MARRRQAAQRGQVGQRVAVDQGLAGSGRQREPAGAGLGIDVIDVEQTRGGLLLEPLAHVALMQEAGVGELAGRRGPAFVQRAVQPQAVAQVDRRGLDRAEARSEQAVLERLGG